MPPGRIVKDTGGEPRSGSFEARQPMERKLSDRLMEDLSASLRTALSTQRIVNIARLAEEIRRRNEAENVALEDIQAQLVAQAQLFNAVMEFDSPHDGS
jgi:hypothetical protein